MILIHNLSKVYGQNTVLKNISMRFDEGKIYGLIGSNGCGKTTLMRCICGFSQPTSGYIVVNGCLIGGRSALRRNPWPGIRLCPEHRRDHRDTGLPAARNGSAEPHAPCGDVWQSGQAPGPACHDRAGA